MPKKGGGKAKGGKKVRRGKKEEGGASRYLVKSDGPQQQYAQALKPLGDRRFLANCYDPKSKCWVEKVIHVRGKFRKRVWVNVGDFVLVSTREFETDGSKDGGYPSGGDVIHVYKDNEPKRLAKMGEFYLQAEEEEVAKAGGGIMYVDSDDSESEDPLASPKKKEPEIAPQRYRGMLPNNGDSDDESLESMIANL